MAGDCLSRWVWTEASKAMFKRLDDITVERLISSNYKDKNDSRD
jgi:DNA-binding IscR family transcriptional regulator